MSTWEWAQDREDVHRTDSTTDQKQERGAWTCNGCEYQFSVNEEDHPTTGHVVCQGKCQQWLCRRWCLGTDRYAPIRSYQSPAGEKLICRWCVEDLVPETPQGASIAMPPPPDSPAEATGQAVGKDEVGCRRTGEGRIDVQVSGISDDGDASEVPRDLPML